VHEYIGYKENAEGYGNTEWRINPKYPLGMLLDGGIHEIATLSKIFGRPLSVYAAGIKYRQDGYGDYDYQSMVFGYGNNSIGVFSNSYYLDGERNYLIIRGTKGLAFFEYGPEITVEENSGRKDIIKLKDEDPTYNMWKDFVNCLETNSKPYYTTSKALNDLQILEAIKKSLENGTRLKIDFTA